MGKILIFKDADWQVNAIENIGPEPPEPQWVQKTLTLHNVSGYPNETTGVYTTHTIQRSRYIQITAGKQYKIVYGDVTPGDLILSRYGCYTSLPSVGSQAFLYGINTETGTTAGQKLTEVILNPTSNGYLLVSCVDEVYTDEIIKVYESE